mgnify:CR=1 FL=1
MNNTTTSEKFRPNEMYYCTVKYGGTGGTYSTYEKTFKSESHYLNWCKFMMSNYGGKVLEIKHHLELNKK